MQALRRREFLNATLAGSALAALVQPTIWHDQDTALRPGDIDSGMLGGQFTNPKAIIQLAELPAKSPGLLLQQVTLDYSQPLTLVGAEAHNEATGQELPADDEEPVYYIGGRATGTLTTSRMVAPQAVWNHFCAQLSGGGIPTTLRLTLLGDKLEHGPTYRLTNSRLGMVGLSTEVHDMRILYDEPVRIFYDEPVALVIYFDALESQAA